MNINCFILLPVILPIVFGLILLLFPIKNDKARDITNFIFVLINTALSFTAMLSWYGEGISVVEFYSGLGLEFKLDRAACIFGTVVSSLWPFASLYAYGYMKHHERKNSFFAFFTAPSNRLLKSSSRSRFRRLYIRCMKTETGVSS